MTMYASKTPRDLNHDPEPWRSLQTGARHAQRSKYGHAQWQHRPRAEFDHVQHNEPNPVLLWAREADLESVLDEVTFSSGSYMVGTWVGDRQVTSEHIVHARRVLARLARLEASS